MSEIKKTLTLGGIGAGLVLVALITAPRPATPDAFLDRGDPFFPDFVDPNMATTLEVIEFDEETAAASRLAPLRHYSRGQYHRRTPSREY